MKKNLRSKILLCVLAGGVLAANTAFAAEYTETISGTDDTSYSAIKEQNGNDYTYNFNDGDSLNLNNVQNGVVITPNSNVDSITINGKLDINLTGDKANTHTSVSGICADYNTDGKFIDYRDGGNITLNVESDTAYFAGGVLLAGTNDEIKIGDSNISVSLFSNDTYGITAVGILVLYEGTKVETDNININVSTNIKDYYNEAVGIYIQDGATYTANGDTNIKAVSNGYGELTAYGVLTFGSSEINLGNVDIYAEAVKNEKNDSYAYGIYAYNDSVVNMDGGKISVKTNEENSGAYSIYTFSDGAVNINQTGGNDVVVNGDVYNNGGSVNLNLNTANSEFNGAVNDNSNNGTTLNLANSAEWNNTGASNLNTLSMDSGIINQNVDEDISINNYSGTGDINFKAEDTDNNGVLNLANTGDVVIGEAAKGSAVNLGITNNTINTLDIEKTEENLNAIAEKVSYTGTEGNLTGKVTVKEGLITPEASGDLLFDTNNNKRGYVSNVIFGDKVTQTMKAMQNFSETAIVAWRQEDSTLSQRLGELRHSEGGQGIWVRMSRGEFEYDGEYKNQYNFFQMGYDWAAGSWHYGAAVSHNDGQTTYTHGDGENRSTSLSLYGTWLGDKGHYADIVLKQGRLSNDFDIYTEAGHTSGDYDAWGTSLSGEYGMKVDLDGGWYVTPQAQLTLMRIGGEDYTTNNGIKVNQDSLESAVGRVGFEVGKRISDSGSIYAKASLLHDFAGSADTYLSLNGLTNSYHQDIGDTWCEAGIGFNYKTSENSYVYADVVKTFGGDVETPWQWNAGMRWTF